MGLLCLGVLACAGTSAEAQISLCETINPPPGATYFWVEGINNGGDVVGWYYDADYNVHGFRIVGGQLATLDVTDALWTAAYGINDAGQIVGEYYTDQDVEYHGVHGFLLSGGQYSTIDVGAFSTQPRGINNARTVVGHSHETGGDIQDSDRGFVLALDGLTRIDAPGGSENGIRPVGINDDGNVVGSVYIDGYSHGFQWIDGELTLIDYPDTQFGSSAVGVNNTGRILGNYYEGRTRPYILTHDQFSTPRCPAAIWPSSTIANGISNNGKIVGMWVDADYVQHAFVTPALPFAARLRLNTFIATDFVFSPVDTEEVYGGDDRSFCEDCGSERMDQEVTVFNPMISETDLADGPSTGVWLTQEFDTLTSLDFAATPVRLLQAAKDDMDWGAPMKTAWGMASLDNDDTCTAARVGAPPTNRMQIHCVASASDPLIPFSPDIDFDYTVTLSFWADSIHYVVAGCHDGFPSHEVYINGVSIMKYDQSGHTVWELFAPCDQTVTEEGDIQ